MWAPPALEELQRNISPRFHGRSEAKCILDNILVVCEEGVKEPKKSHFQISLSQIRRKTHTHTYTKDKKSSLTEIPDEF